MINAVQLKQIIIILTSLLTAKGCKNTHTRNAFCSVKGAEEDTWAYKGRGSGDRRQLHNDEFNDVHSYYSVYQDKTNEVGGGI